MPLYGRLSFICDAGMMRDWLIALAWAVIAEFVADGIQMLIGGNRWLPDGSFAFASVFSAIWFSRHPVMERR